MLPNDPFGNMLDVPVNFDWVCCLISYFLESSIEVNTNDYHIGCVR